MFKRKMLLIPILVFLLTCLVGCNNTDKPIDNPQDKVGTATSYGLVNKTYVGAATVKIKNDKIEDVTYDEAFLPNTWAALNYTHEEGKELPDEVLHHLKNDHNQCFHQLLQDVLLFFVLDLKRNRQDELFLRLRALQVV